MAAEGDTSALHHCARGLAGLQARWGAFATIKGAGPAAAAVADIAQRMRRELGPAAPPVGDASHLLPGSTLMHSLWVMPSTCCTAAPCVRVLRHASTA